jgi:hypothetical protein
MNPGCEAARQAISELTLGVVDGQERATLMGHLANCVRCQKLCTELADVADAFGQLVPEMEPPAGFAHGLEPSLRAGRRSGYRFSIVATIIIAAASVLGVATIAIHDGGSRTHAGAKPGTLRSATMLGADSSPVGDVVVSAGSPARLVVAVGYRVPDGRYALIFTQAGRNHSLGQISVTGGHGQWVGEASITPGQPVRTLVVANTGTIVCHATLNEAP